MRPPNRRIEALAQELADTRARLRAYEDQELLELEPAAIIQEDPWLLAAEIDDILFEEPSPPDPRRIITEEIARELELLGASYDDQQVEAALIRLKSNLLRRLANQRQAERNPL